MQFKDTGGSSHDGSLDEQVPYKQKFAVFFFFFFLYPSVQSKQPTGL